MTFDDFTLGSYVEWQESYYEVLKKDLVEGKVVIKSLESGEQCQVPPNELFLFQRSEEMVGADIHADSKALEIAKFRYRIIKPFLYGRRGDEVRLEQAVKARVSVSTLYIWLRLYKEAGSLHGLLPKLRIRSKKLNASVDGVLRELCKSFYFTQRRPTVKQLHEKIRGTCKELNLKPPCYNTIRARVRDFDPKLALKLRENGMLAENLFGADGGQLVARFPLELVQIDHTLLDIEIVDEMYREPIGRPWVTICIDIYTRMVVGFSLNLHAPSALSAGLAVRNAVLPKAETLKELGIDDEWPCAGLMSRLHMDNGKDFHSDMLAQACEIYEIDMEFRPAGKPNWGAHIERYMKTLADHLKTYRGSTHGAKDKKLKRKPRKHASMTLKELEASLLTFILGDYHKRPHSSLGISPLEKWHLGQLGSVRDPGIGAPPIFRPNHLLKRDFLPFEKRSLSSGGVQINGIWYNDAIFDELRRIPGADKEDLIFRFDPRNLKIVFVYHPKKRTYFPVRYKNKSRPPLNIWQVKAAKNWLNKNGFKGYVEDDIFKTTKKLEKMAEQSRKSTAKRRRRRQQSEDANNIYASETEGMEESTDLPEVQSEVGISFDGIEP